MDIQKIFENNREWVTSRLNEDSTYFEEMSKGQSPEILYIGCSDSRVTAEELMGLGPGQVFVHRNIANMVPNLDYSSASVINYAVAHLKVNHLVVCGHYYCGGVKAAMDSADLGILNPWLREIMDVQRIHKAELDSIQDEDQKYRRLIELNVQEQCVNALKVEVVQRAYRERGLKIHGWVFDIKTGKLVDLDINVDSILSGIDQIYQVD